MVSCMVKKMGVKKIKVRHPWAVRCPALPTRTRIWTVASKIMMKKGRIQSFALSSIRCSREYKTKEKPMDSTIQATAWIHWRASRSPARVKF